VTQGVSVRAFARQDGCNEALARRGLKTGHLTPFSDGTVDPSMARTGWRKGNRRGADSADLSVPFSPDAGLAARDGETAEQTARRIVDSDAPHTQAEAERIKENYLAMLRQLEYDQKTGAVVAIADVAAIVGADYARHSNLAPPLRLTLSQWVERHAVLSRQTSAQTGRFRAYAYQTGILDAVTDPAVTRITVMKSARVGYTKCLDHIVGYFLSQDPSPVLVVQPRVEDAEDYSSTEIEPMLRDTPVLAVISGDLKSRNSKQKLLKRIFRNGASVSFVGANSPGGFRRITARIILFDEVDGYPITGAGKEGDQIALGTKRSETFWNRKIVLGSTPTLKGTSRIEKSCADSDQRHFFVPCPQCA
jgi:hypothetical protein